MSGWRLCVAFIDKASDSLDPWFLAIRMGRWHLLLSVPLTTHTCQSLYLQTPRGPDLPYPAVDIALPKQREFRTIASRCLLISLYK